MDLGKEKHGSPQGPAEISGDDRRSSVGARRSEATEAAILDATAALIAESGYGALTMEAVAKRARAGKATLYRWWPTKAHLLLGLISRAKGAMPPPRGAGLREELVAYMTDMVTLWRTDGGGMGPLIRQCYAESWSNPELALALQEERRARWTMLTEILERAEARGELPHGLDLSRAKDFLMSWPFYRLMTDRLPRPEEVAQMVEDSLSGLQGMAGQR
jgi:AcrR family transcriptional regulator